MTPPRDDAAPAATGAGVNGPNTSPDSTFARSHLTPPARRNGPETSRIAARRIAGHTQTIRDRIEGFIDDREAYGATDDEGEAALGIKCSTYTPRRGELVGLGRVVYAGHKRSTGSGRPAMVWVAARFAPKPATGARTDASAPGDAATPEGGAQ